MLILPETGASIISYIFTSEPYLLEKSQIKSLGRLTASGSRMSSKPRGPKGVKNRLRAGSKSRNYNNNKGASLLQDVMDMTKTTVKENLFMILLNSGISG